MKKWLPPQPRLWPGDGKLYVCASRWPSNGLFRGIPFSKGLACEGRPITSDMIEVVRSAGQMVTWWEYADGIQVEWFSEGPRACVEVSGEPQPAIEGATVEIKPVKKKKKRSRPKKNG